MNSHSETADLIVDHQKYRVQLFRNICLSPEYPRLLIPVYIPNRKALEVLVVCIQSIQKFTPQLYELWVVDNHSPRQYTEWLTRQNNINLVLNERTPIPPDKNNLWNRTIGNKQYRWGSYANALGLEIALRFIDQNTNYVFTMHMDTLACHPEWLAFLLSKVGEKVRAVGFRLDKYRNPEGVLHVLGMMFDYQLFKLHGLDLFPQLPHIDVGDKISISFREAGYKIFACRNTYNQPGLVSNIPPDSKFKTINVDRFFDDEENIIFLHLGRGVRKSLGKHNTGVAPEDWVKWAKLSGIAEGLHQP